MNKGRLDFKSINARLMADYPGVLFSWIPGGRVQGGEYVSRNPRRDDRSPGSFKVNIATGRWADFATADRGGDPISLYAYLHGLSQGQAARELAVQLGVSRG